MKTVKMQVVDATARQPISDAVVTLTGAGLAELTVISDGEGRCSADVPDELAMVHAHLEHEGYAVGDLDLMPIDGLVLHMEPDAAPKDVILPEPPPREMLGAIAFGAYNASRGGKNHLGQPTPPWESLPPEIREAWCAAAQAVVEASGGMRGQ